MLQTNDDLLNKETLINDKTVYGKIENYEIKHMICFSTNHGFAFCKNKTDSLPYAIYQFTEKNQKRHFYKRFYFSKKESAIPDYIRRIKNYIRHYKVDIKYNYLAATEMSKEQNYNFIDGVQNNELLRADLTDGQTYEEIQELAPETLPSSVITCIHESNSEYSPLKYKSFKPSKTIERDELDR